MLSLPSHVLDLILDEYNTTCEIAVDNGLVSVLLDILSSFYLDPSKSDSLPDFKYVIPMLLVVDNFLQLKQKFDSNIMIFKQSKKKDGDVENTENLESNHLNRTTHTLVVPKGYITTKEQKKTINIVCNFIQMNLTSTVVQALLQLCARLKRVHAIALCFLERGGLVSLLIFPTSCLFSWFNSVASTIVCHILEDPHMLQVAMELEI